MRPNTPDGLDARRVRRRPASPLAVSAAAALFLLLSSGAAHAQTVVITLDGIPATACNETWTESGVTLQHVVTAPEDCDGGGNCSILIRSTDTGLAPARLELDLTGLAGPVASAEVDVQDSCGSGCTRAFLYDGAAQVDSAANIDRGVETLTVSAGGAAVDRLGISSCEGFVREVRLELGTGNPVPGLSRIGVLGLVILLIGAVSWLTIAPRRRDA